MNYRRRFNLEEVLQEWEAEQGSHAPNGEGSPPGEAGKNSSNTSGKSTDEDDEEVRRCTLSPLLLLTLTLTVNPHLTGEPPLLLLSLLPSLLSLHLIYDLIYNLTYYLIYNLTSDLIYNLTSDLIYDLIYCLTSDLIYDLIYCLTSDHFMN